MPSEEIGSLYVRLEMAMDQFQKAGQKAESVLGKIAKGALGVGAILGAGKIFKGFLSEASEAQENMAQLDAALASTGGVAGVTRDQALSLAEGLSKLTRFSDDAILAGENMLLTFTNIGKNVFPNATQTMLDMSQALGQDMKSSAVQLGKALNDPIAGVSALSRVGVTFTESQKAMIAKLVESGDTMAAQKLILEELNKEFGGSAKAAGETFPGQLDRLKNALGDVQESIGERLMPVLQNMATKIQDHMPQIQAFVDNAITKMGAAIGFVTDNSNILIPVLGGVAAGIAALKVAEAVSKIMQGWSVIVKGLTIAQTGLNLVMAANPFAIVALGLAGLVAGGVLLWRNWDTVKAKTMEVWGSIRDFVHPIIEGLTSAFKFWVNGYISAINFMVRSLNRLRIDVPDWIPEIGGKSFGFSIPELPKLAKGTNFVPYDTLAYLHRGEAVVPAANNPSNPGASASVGIDYERLAGAVASKLAPLINHDHAINMDGQKVAKALWSPLVGEKQRLGLQGI